jgi:hypothetical protein
MLGSSSPLGAFFRHRLSGQVGQVGRVSGKLIVPLIFGFAILMAGMDCKRNVAGITFRFRAWARTP